MKENAKDIKLLSKSVNSGVDHLEILDQIYYRYMETGNELSNLMKFYLNGLDEIPTIKVKEVWNLDAFNKQRLLFIDRYPELLEILQKDFDSFKYNFRIIKAKDFNSTRFKEYPLWSEYYDYDELIEIEEWGYDKKLTLKELLSKDIENQHPYYTAPITEFPLERMRYFTRSKFVTKSNIEIDGVIMNKGEIAIGLFIDKEIVTLSNHPALSKMMNASLKKVANYFKLDVFELKTLKFETNIPINRQKRIKGTWVIEYET